MLWNNEENEKHFINNLQRNKWNKTVKTKYSITEEKDMSLENETEV